jgi:hypothetical protein
MLQRHEGRPRWRPPGAVTGWIGRTLVCLARGPAGFLRATCREPDLAVCLATGDNRLYANILLTVGYIAPSS